MHTIYYVPIRILSFLGVLCFSLINLAQPGLIRTFVSGDYLRATHTEWPYRFNSGIVSTPIVPGNLMSPEIEIYYHFLRPYTQSKPTLVYLPGLSHLSIHNVDPKMLDLLQNLNFNVLLVEMRGTGFSKPFRVVDYEYAQMYDIHSFASDLESIRKHLKLNQWSLWAHGFGATVALSYAHKFPNQTHAMLLENPIAGQTGQSLQMSPQVQELLQNFLSHLPPDIKQKWLQADPQWLVDLAQDFIGLQGAMGLALLSSILKDFNNVEGQKFIPLVQRAATERLNPNFRFRSGLSEPAYHTLVMNHHFSYYSPQAKRGWKWDAKLDRLISARLSHEPLPSWALRAQNHLTHHLPPFDLSQVPPRVPLTVIQGEWDTLASISQAQRLLALHQTPDRARGIHVLGAGRFPLLQSYLTARQIPQGLKGPTPREATADFLNALQAHLSPAHRETRLWQNPHQNSPISWRELTKVHPCELSLSAPSR